MTDQLKNRLAVLTDDRPEPADPAIQVRQSIVHRRRRRTGVAVVACAAATAAAVLAVPALGSLRSASELPGVAGIASPSPQATKTTEGPMPDLPVTDHHRVLPQPWSTEAVTQKSIAYTFWPNKGYYISKGTIPTEKWSVVVTSTDGCLFALEGPASNFGDPNRCFGQLPDGQPDPSSTGKYQVMQGFTKEKSTIKINATMVWGKAPIGASAVKVKAGGKTYTAAAVATPATDTLRFFALVIPDRDLKVTEVTAVDKAGKPVGAALVPTS